VAARVQSPWLMSFGLLSNALGDFYPLGMTLEKDRGMRAKGNCRTR
jgi:hypothetical protein